MQYDVDMNTILSLIVTINTADIKCIKNLPKA